MTPVQQTLSSLTLISQTKKTTEKEAILRRLQNVEVAKTLISHAVDKLTNHWLTVDPDAFAGKFTGGQLPAELDARFAEFDRLCRRLQARVITGAAASMAVSDFLCRCSDAMPYKEGSSYIGVLNKHLNIGIANAAIQKVWPDLVSDFGVPLAESLYNQTSGNVNQDVYDAITFPVTMEPKLDGANGSIVSAPAGRGGVFSRDEGQWPALVRWYKALRTALENISRRTKKDVTSWVLNGEFKACQGEGDPSTWKSSWGKTVALVRSGIAAGTFDETKISEHARVCLDRGDLIYYAYDTYPYSAYRTGKWAVSYGHKTIPGTRSHMCAAIVAEMRRVDPGLAIVHVEQHIANNWGEVDKLHDKFINELHEGSMLKQHLPCVLDRTTNIVKVKRYRYRDAVVLGVNQGTNSNKDKAGTFEVWFPDADVTGKVSVRTNELKVWAWEHKDALAGFKLEVAEQDDKLSVSKSRNPTLKRARVDVAPVPVEEVTALCRKFGYPEPTRPQLHPVLFKRAIASFKISE